jgi:hypothetical protein
MMQRDELGESETLLLAAYPVLRDKLGQKARQTQSALRTLVKLNELLGRPQNTAEFRARVIERSGPPDALGESLVRD